MKITSFSAKTDLNPLSWGPIVSKNQLQELMNRPLTGPHSTLKHLFEELKKNKNKHLHPVQIVVRRVETRIQEQIVEVDAYDFVGACSIAKSMGSDLDWSDVTQIVNQTVYEVGSGKIYND